MSQNEKIVQELLVHNAKQSADFIKSASARKHLVKDHPTKIIVFECMDGRVNFPLSVELPFGIVSSFRSMGGIFDLGVSRFAKTLNRVVGEALAEKRHCLLVVTYHFSKSDVHKGCKGHDYNTEAAKLVSEKFCTELKQTFASAKNKVYPVVLGIETDEDRFIISGEDIETLPAAMRKDTDFILGENEKHADSLPQRTEKEIQHGENMIAVGLGFDWLHSYNRALIIGPWCHGIDESIATAASIVLSNLKEKRITENEGVLLVCGSVLSKKEAQAISEHCVEIIKARVPEVASCLHVLAGATDPKTRKFVPIK